MNRNKILLSFLLLFFQQSYSQLLLNGADFIITNNGIVSIQTDSLIINNNATFHQNGFLRVDKDLINESGTLRNSGESYVLENVIINDSIIGLPISNQFYVSGNWINNSVFQPGFSTVILNGTTQEIRGTSQTSFYNLVAQGNLNDKKELVNVNSNVLNVLDLGNVELATNTNNISILNPDVNSILRNNGFVSNLDTGKLERNTNSTNSYLFPTGSTLGITRYRPVSILPNSVYPNTFGVRLANLEPSLEGFDVLSLGDSLCAVNPNFYHRLYSDNSSADITLYFDPSLDGNWETIANWQSSDLWEENLNNSNPISTNFTSITSSNISDFSEPAFALAIEKPILVLDDFLEIVAGESVLVTPIYTGPIPDNVYWLPLEENSCPVCLETDLSPISTTQYEIELYITETCLIKDSILIRVKRAGLQLPTAFSPNFDGVNDYLIPLNENIEDYEISVFNRWGELIFQSKDLTTGWDGTYKGNSSPLGVYSYKAKYKNIGSDKLESKNGNITIIR